MSEQIDCDLLILGGGIAGLTAAIYGTRYNLKTIVVAKSFGGTANLAGHIENWPGFTGTGMELLQKVYQQAKDHGAELIEEEFNNLTKENDYFKLTLKDKEIKAKSLIIALGMQHRKLDVKGEKELVGKGVSYCATCDGMFFKNKTVLVVGGSDSAAKAALYLSEIAKKVYIAYRKSEMRCEPISLQKLKGKENIEINYFSNPVEILGDKKVTGIILKQDNEKDSKTIKLDVDGIFIEIGATPFIDVVKPIGVSLDEKGFIITNKDSKTNIPGVFAAGDNTNTGFKQLVVGAGEGALAAKSAYDFIRFGK